jgi:putative NADH-flavin reductase
MKLIIFGATGATGKQLTGQALAQGHEVTAFVRNPSKLSMQHPRLTLVQGDVRHYETVLQAIQGKEAVLSALGANSPFRYDPVVVNGLAHIIRAMEAAQVLPLIYLSFIGVSQSRAAAGTLIRVLAPTLLRTETKGHTERETLIRRSLLHWIIVQAPTLTNGPLLQQYRWGEDIHTASFVSSLSRADVANFMLTQLKNGRYARKVVRLLP